jgi:photosystem II stability/assembly factor-like uncharacterized protein
MKKFTITFLLIFTIFCTTILNAQPYGWYTQTSGTTSNLNNVKFVNPTTGTIVGQSGKILKTTNAGTNWVTQTSGTTNHLFGVYFLNANTGWAVGDIGTILFTTNGGNSWVTQTSNTFYQLRQITFLNSTTGFIVAWYGTILKTTNAGTNWISQNTGTSNNLLGISFANANTGFAVGWYGTAIKTTNGGTSWTTLNSGTTNTLEDVTFFDTQVGLIVGENGNVQRTTNGGTNWTTQSSGTGNWISGITSPHTNFATMIGELGIIRTTTNAGANWHPQVSNTGNWLHKINYVDTLNGWAVGDYGTIIHTTTGGWLLPTAPPLSSPSNNSSCVSLTPNITWSVVFPPVCTYRLQIATSNTFTSPVLDSAGILYLNLNIPSSRLNYGTQYYWRVMATNQVGPGPWSSVRSFTTTYPTPSAPTLSLPTTNAILSTLTPLLDWDSVTSAYSFRIRVSSDSTFATTTIDTSNLNVSKYQVPTGRLQNGVKYFWRVNASNSCVTSAWSATWSFRAVLAPAAPNLVAPINNSNISNLIPLFDWDTVTSASTFRIVISSDSLFASSVVDSSGILLTKYQIPAGKLQYGNKYYWRVNASNPYFTGPWSQVWNFQALITGIGNTPGDIPNVFKLYDNYPNPFNPVTKIKFDLPENAFVKISIYDITGREVSNILKREVNAGSYEVQFNAGNLSSGTYFYRIEAGNFTEVKRMVLIK